jgi:hypothetical protein
MKRLLLFAVLGLCVFFGGEQIRLADAATLLPYGTNLGRVVDLEINYFPDRTQLQVAATTDTRFVKRGEYRNDTAIQNVLQLVRFKERGKLFVVYEDNRIISFFVQD